MQAEEVKEQVKAEETKQSTSPQEDVFLKHTNTFKLSVKLTSTSLSITLQNYLDWVVYEKVYTEEDIGKEINKKAELADIYSSFSQAENSDELKMEMEKAKPISEYKFGDVIQLMGIPCYKIESQGRLTVYLDLYDRKTKKPLIYESNLKLPKLKQLSQIEILVRKFEFEKMAEEKGVPLYTEELKKERLLQLLLKQQNQLSQFEKVKSELRLANQKVKEYQKSKLDLVKEYEAKLKLAISEKQKSEKAYQIQNRQLQQSKLKVNKISDELKQEKNRVDFLSQEDFKHFVELGHQQANIQEFRIILNIVQYVGTDNKWTQYLVHSFLPYNKFFRFKVKILRSSNGKLGIGIVEYRSRKIEKTSMNINSDSIFLGCNNSCYPNIIQNGTLTNQRLYSKFDENSIVQVVVNLKQGTIKWCIGTQCIQTTSYDIKSSSKIYVPAIEFYNKNDIVEIIG